MGAPQMKAQEMLVEEYDKAKHFDLMNSWYVGWGYKPIPEKYMPSLGFVVGGCAMQLIALTDCDVAWFESFISDPQSDPEIRRRAIEIAHECCIAKVRALGIDRIFTFVRRQHVLETALKSAEANGVSTTSTPGFLIEGTV